MFAALQILFPVFGLMLSGFLCGKRGVLGPTAASELNKFVVWLALPALLFDIMAKSSWSELYLPGFIATFSLTCAAVFALVLACGLLRGRHLADASIDALAASYPNTGYVGFPLCLLVFGSASRTPTTIATILVTCVLFGIGIALTEAGLQVERKPHRLAAKVLMSLLRNPLIVAPILGALFAATKLALPKG
ncbi:MAG TPA: AEC family transporter, partial [Rhodanobacter sp.]